MLDKFLFHSHNAKRFAFVLLDIVLLPLALWMSFALRLSNWWPENFIRPDIWLFYVAPIVAIPGFVRLGLYRAVVKYMGLKALFTIVNGVTISTVLLMVVAVLGDARGVPRSVFIIYWGVSLLFIGGSRMMVRYYFQNLFQEMLGHQHVAIYGAGSAGAQLAKALQTGGDYFPVIFLDDNKKLQGREIHGIKVYSPVKLETLIKERAIIQVLLAMPSAPRHRLKAILDFLEPYPVEVKTLPGIGDLVSGGVKIEDIREVEIEELLGRDPVPAIKNLFEACIKDKVVMVTGAGGSIGAELCKQIVASGAKKIILYERTEFALYTIQEELRDLSPTMRIIPILGSVTDFNRLDSVIHSFAVQTIYHAAAYKHVPLVETNPIEGVQNNVFGTLRTAEAALKNKVETFVLISTDKAVRPTNIMGASKRFAEMILQELDNRTPNTRFVMVRFGNVLGSSGSVIPLFRKQIRQGGPVTVTHPDIIRYFMTIQEAVQLVLQAGALGDGGDVFVLDMGEPVSILYLAKRMIHLSGLEVKDETNSNGDISIEFTGLRPGEKLFEELLIGDNVEKTEHPRIMRAREGKLAWHELTDLLQKLENACIAFRQNEVRELMKIAVDGYNPQCGIEDTVWKKINAAL